MHQCMTGLPHTHTHKKKNSQVARNTAQASLGEMNPESSHRGFSVCLSSGFLAAEIRSRCWNLSQDGLRRTATVVLSSWSAVDATFLQQRRLKGNFSLQRNTFKQDKHYINIQDVNSTLHQQTKSTVSAGVPLKGKERTRPPLKNMFS